MPWTIPCRWTASIAAAEGLVQCEGAGRKRDPYRYWLPGKEEEWKVPAWERELAALTERLSKLPDDPAGGPGVLPPAPLG